MKRLFRPGLVAILLTLAACSEGGADQGGDASGVKAPSGSVRDGDLGDGGLDCVTGNDSAACMTCCEQNLSAQFALVVGNLAADCACPPAGSSSTSSFPCADACTSSCGGTSLDPACKSCLDEQISDAQSGVDGGSKCFTKAYTACAASADCAVWLGCALSCPAM